MHREEEQMNSCGACRLSDSDKNLTNQKSHKIVDLVWSAISNGVNLHLRKHSCLQIDGVKEIRADRVLFPWPSFHNRLIVAGGGGIQPLPPETAAG